VIDTHCHLNFDSFDLDRNDIIARAASVGVARLINPAIDLPTSAASIELTRQFDGVYAAVGVHPNSTASWSPEHVGAIRDYARSPKVVSIGEIGLDYHWDLSPRAAQIKAFEAQLTLASTLSLPVIIHNREASDDAIAILETWAATLNGIQKERPGVLHSFSGTPDIAERALAIGFYLGFSGPITYKNSEITRRVAAETPLDRILVETDAPFLTPIPHRGKRNEPSYIPLIVERLAIVKHLDTSIVAQATTQNANRLFSLPATGS
jgi:TatD DNase family protein